MPGFEHVAVLLPCYNEELTIKTVVEDFARELPGAKIYVFDNNSSDKTCEVARQAGAIVRQETRQGKGNVVRRMFADVEAQIYVLCDGDDTYPAARAQGLIEHLVVNGLDMVVGRRESEDSEAAYRPGHALGNRMFTGLVGTIFGSEFSDIFSGYRVFSRRFVKSFPAITTGFEIETELTVHALTVPCPSDEVGVPYGARPEGSASKLRTYHDGARILLMVMLFAKEVRPFAFFFSLACLLGMVSVTVMIPVFQDFLETGLVLRFPTAILATGIMLCAALSAACGVILDSLGRARLETKRLHYLSYAGVPVE